MRWWVQVEARQMIWTSGECLCKPATNHSNYGKAQASLETISEPIAYSL